MGTGGSASASSFTFRLLPSVMVFGGAAPSQTFDPVRDLPSMAGKVVIVTGSSSGIGFATLQHLARLGAKVSYVHAARRTRFVGL